jgi:hypothetical protein
LTTRRRQSTDVAAIGQGVSTVRKQRDINSPKTTLSPAYAVYLSPVAPHPRDRPSFNAIVDVAALPPTADVWVKANSVVVKR